MRTDDTAAKTLARLIAFYLPQFHPTPENDAWWGRGFTEWTNVASARPLFEGHQQPDLPSELGFYDLRLPEVRQSQADLARQYGIHGFCYYHYWFNGRHLLDRPFNEVLASGTPAFPFCLCWANENWTRAWDGSVEEVLIAQRYGPEDDRHHIQWLAPALSDTRYIRVDSKPLLLIYRIASLPNPIQTAAIWREEARRLGVGEVFLATVDSLRDDRIDPTRFGFDASIEFQPDWLDLGTPQLSLGDGNEVYPYRSLVDRALEKPAAPFRQFRCVATGWDNSPRRRRNARIFAGSTPELYQRWLESAIDVAGRAGHEPIVFINAWNEWAEGAHLEPSQRQGRGYLEATRRALESSTARRVGTVASGSVPLVRRRPKVSVCIPTFNGARFLLEAVNSVLAQTFDDFELLIVDDASGDDSANLAASFDDPRVHRLVNPIRLGLVGNWNRCLDLAGGEYVSVFHQDDVMAPDNLREKVAFLDSNASAGFVHSNVFQIGPEGELISRCWYSEPTEDQEGVHGGYDYFRTLLTGLNIVSCPSVVIRRSCIDKVGRFSPELPFTADWEMWMRSALFCDVGYLTKPLVHYRRHEGQETFRFSGLKDLEQGYLAKTLVLNRHRERIPDYKELRRRVLEYYGDAALALLRQYEREGKRAEASRCLAFVVQVHGEQAKSPRDYTDWFVRVAIDLLNRDGPAQERSGPPAPGVDSLGAALQDARNEVAALRGSLSWKVTAPLRAVYGAMLRLKASAKN
jgi:glycosyltransferase involved in cell wall biosynthesis